MAASHDLKKYLIVLAHVQGHINFRIQELLSLISFFDAKVELHEENYSERTPFLVVSSKSEEDVKKLMSRSVLSKCAVELWGTGNTYSQLYDSIFKNITDEQMQYYCRHDFSFKILVKTFSKTILHEKKDLTEHIPFKGKLNLKNSDHTFHLIEDYGLHPNTVPEQPFNVYFGRWIADGQRDKITQYSIKKRHFIGNTTMSPELSFIMANQAAVSTTSLVLDPFAGTGGLLLACSHFGAYVIGTDIDYNIIHGISKPSRSGQKKRNPDECIRTNMEHYQLHNRFIDVFVADAAHHVWKQSSIFDAIITDPPYGVRESTRKIGTKKDNPEIIDRESHIPSNVSYNLSDIFTDLLNFAANYLVLGGRLVYWLPVERSNYSPEIVPQHPCLELLSNSEQILSKVISRRLITMRKVKENSDNIKKSAFISENVYDKHQAIRSKVYSNEKK